MKKFSEEIEERPYLMEFPTNLNKKVYSVGYVVEDLMKHSFGPLKIKLSYLIVADILRVYIEYTEPKKHILALLTTVFKGINVGYNELDVLYRPVILKLLAELVKINPGLQKQDVNRRIWQVYIDDENRYGPLVTEQPLEDGLFTYVLNNNLEKGEIINE